MSNDGQGDGLLRVMRVIKNWNMQLKHNRGRFRHEGQAERLNMMGTKGVLDS
jgi:hypothetical protein